MRLIPRNTKVKLQFYKGITLTDIILALVCLALVAITLASNFYFKYLIALGVVCVFIPLFLPVGEERIYRSALYMLRHLFGRKRYYAGGTDGAGIEGIVPHESIRNGVIRNKDGSCTGGLEIKPMEFRLLAGGKQDYLIDGVLANALSIIGVGQEAEIVKLDKTLNLDRHLRNELKRVETLIALWESETLSAEEYAARMDIVEDRMELLDILNSEQSVTYAAYYLVVHDISGQNLISTLQTMKNTLSAGSIESQIVSGAGLAEFLRLAYRIPDGADTPKEVKFGLTSVLQDGTKLSHFAVTGYPLKVGNAWGEELFGLENTKVVMKLKPVEKSKAIRRIDNAIAELSTRAKGRASKVIDNTTHIETLSALVVRLQNDNETLFDVTLVITAYDEKGKADNKKRVRRKLKENGFSANEMFGRQADA